VQIIEHPWNRTLREHLAWIRSYYGEEVAEAVGRLAYLRGLQLGEIVELDSLRTLLVRVGIPAVDVGLDPNPTDTN
jgi:hypothetical protein